MNRIDRKFAELKKARKKALILYMTAGDPGLAQNEKLVYAFEKVGVDLIELGVPFSDPLADGPVIQAASGRALARGTTLAKILALVKKIRRRSQVPLLLMSYLNPLLNYGLDRFARDAAKAGVDGVIVPDLPPDEGRDVSATLRKAGIHVVYLLAPTSTPERTRFVTRASRGFVYYVSITGVTGSKAMPSEAAAKLKKAQRVSRLPVCVGFGVSTPDQARLMARSADGVIIGSAIVRALDDNPKLDAEAFTARFVRPFAKAVGGTR